MRNHPARLYIAFSAFTLFILMMLGMAFLFSTRTAGTLAKTDGQSESLLNEYQMQIDKFFREYSAANDKIAFLKNNQHVLFEIKVPKEFLDKHFQLVVDIDKIIN